MLTELLLMLGSGAFTGLITVICIKKDVEWIKEIMTNHDDRLTYIERKI